MDFSGQTPSLEMSVRVLPSGAAHSRGGRSLLGVGGAAPAPFLLHGRQGWDIPGHSRTFPVQPWELSPARGSPGAFGTSWEGMWLEKYQRATSKSASLGSGVWLFSRQWEAGLWCLCARGGGERGLCPVSEQQGAVG